MTPTQALTLAEVDAAFEAEIARVSHVEYDSNEICRHFYGKLRERLAALSAPQGVPQAVPADLLEAVDTLLSEALCDCHDKMKHEDGRHFSWCHLSDLNDARVRMLTAAPAAPKPAEARELLPERLMRFLLRDLKAARADLEGFLSLGNEVKRAAEYDEWIAALDAYCQQYAPAAPQE